jgi:hypothetical protein
MAGCDRSTQTDLVPVRGQVFFRSRPAAGAVVILHPVGTPTPEQWPNGYPRGTVSPDGSLEIGTRSSRDGAPAGDYKILVQWPASSGSNGGEGRDTGANNVDRFRGRYATSARSPWQAKVESPETELPRLDLN